MLEQFEVNGLRFAASVEHDESHGAPWDEEDGHGVVTGWRRNYDHQTHTPKAPGERVLVENSHGARFYDFAASLEIAKRDGWGLSIQAHALLQIRLGREPTAREVTAEAVRLDFERMRAWCRDEWSWVGVCVVLLDVNGKRTHERASLWGIESDAGAYLDEVARELAEEIAERVGDASELVRRTRVRAL